VGSISIATNDSATNINVGSLNVATGNVSIEGNTSVASVSLDSLTSVGGALSVDGNAAVGSVDLSSLTNVDGDITIASNGSNAVVNLNSLTNYGGGTNAVTMTVDAGTVEMTNGLTVETNATLAGSTTVDGSVTNNGTISPGSSPGHLNFTRNLVLAAASRLRMEVAGYAPGQLDLVTVGGQVTLGGTLSVTLLNSFPSVMTNGAGFTVLTAGSPLTGAFANVASGGTLVTTDGYARFTVRYAGENTLRLTDLVIMDRDSDGLPDWWEDSFGLDKTNSADAAGDSDGDGASNLNEFAAGTNPTNAASLFRVVSVQQESNDVRLTWATVGGKSYRVQTNGNMFVPFADFGPLISVIGAGESTTNFVDSNAVPNAATRYYRVRLEP
jgi:hypothetical protein